MDTIQCKQNKDKENQKRLKKIYREELKKAWNTEDMIDFCAKDVGYIIEHDNKLYSIRKPRINTYFCFGYGINGVSTQEEVDEAYRREELIRTSKQYFIDENLKDLNRWLQQLNNIKSDMKLKWVEGSHPIYMITVGEKYPEQHRDCKLNYFEIVNTFGNIYGELCNDISFIDKLIFGYEQVKKDFEKRLNTYLKRYGLSKLKTWTYLSD